MNPARVAINKLYPASIYSRPALAPLVVGVGGSTGYAQQNLNNMYQYTLRQMAVSPFSVNSEEYMKRIREEYGYDDSGAYEVLGTVGTVVGAGIGAFVGSGAWRGVRKPDAPFKVFQPTTLSKENFKGSFQNPLNIEDGKLQFSSKRQQTSEAFRRRNVIDFINDNEDKVNAYNKNLKINNKNNNILSKYIKDNKLEELHANYIKLDNTTDADTIKEINASIDKIKSDINNKEIIDQYTNLKKASKESAEVLSKNIDDISKVAHKHTDDVLEIVSKGKAITKIGNAALGIVGTAADALSLSLNIAGASQAFQDNNILDGILYTVGGLGDTVSIIGDAASLAGKALTASVVGSVAGIPLTVIGEALNVIGTVLSAAAGALVGMKVGETVGHSLSPEGMKAQQLFASNLYGSIINRPITSVATILTTVGVPALLNRMSGIKGDNIFAKAARGTGNFLVHNAWGNYARSSLTMMATQGVNALTTKVEDTWKAPDSAEDVNFVTAFSLVGDINDNLFGATARKATLIGLAKGDPHAQTEALAKAWGYSNEDIYYNPTFDDIRQEAGIDLGNLGNSIVGVIGEILIDPQNLSEIAMRMSNEYTTDYGTNTGARDLNIARAKVAANEPIDINDPAIKLLFNLTDDGHLTKTVGYDPETKTYSILEPTSKHKVEIYRDADVYKQLEVVDNKLTSKVITNPEIADIYKNSDYKTNTISKSTLKQFFEGYITDGIDGVRRIYNARQAQKYTGSQYIVESANDKMFIKNMVAFIENTFTKNAKLNPEEFKNTLINIQKQNPKEFENKFKSLYTYYKIKSGDSGDLISRIVDDFNLRLQDNDIVKLYSLHEGFKNQMDMIDNATSTINKIANPLLTTVEYTRKLIQDWVTTSRGTTNVKQKADLIVKLNDINTKYKGFTSQEIEEAKKDIKNYNTYTVPTESELMDKVKTKQTYNNKQELDRLVNTHNKFEKIIKEVQDDKKDIQNFYAGRVRKDYTVKDSNDREVIYIDESNKQTVYKEIETLNAKPHLNHKEKKRLDALTKAYVSYAFDDTLMDFQVRHSEDTAKLFSLLDELNTGVSKLFMELTTRFNKFTVLGETQGIDPDQFATELSSINKYFSLLGDNTKFTISDEGIVEIQKDGIGIQHKEPIRNRNLRMYYDVDLAEYLCTLFNGELAQKFGEDVLGSIGVSEVFEIKKALGTVDFKSWSSLTEERRINAVKAVLASITDENGPRSFRAYIMAHENVILEIIRHINNAADLSKNNYIRIDRALGEVDKVFLKRMIMSSILHKDSDHPYRKLIDKIFKQLANIEGALQESIPNLSEVNKRNIELLQKQLKDDLQYALKGNPIYDMLNEYIFIGKFENLILSLTSDSRDLYQVLTKAELEKLNKNEMTPHECQAAQAKLASAPFYTFIEKTFKTSDYMEEINEMKTFKGIEGTTEEDQTNNGLLEANAVSENPIIVTHDELLQHITDIDIQLFVSETPDILNLSHEKIKQKVEDWNTANNMNIKGSAVTKELVKYRHTKTERYLIELNRKSIDENTEAFFKEVRDNIPYEFDKNKSNQTVKAEYKLALRSKKSNIRIPTIEAVDNLLNKSIHSANVIDLDGHLRINITPNHFLTEDNKSRPFRDFIADEGKTIGVDNLYGYRTKVEEFVDSIITLIKSSKGALKIEYANKIYTASNITDIKNELVLAYMRYQEGYKGINLLYDEKEKGSNNFVQHKTATYYKKLLHNAITIGINTDIYKGKVIQTPNKKYTNAKEYIKEARKYMLTLDTNSNEYKELSKYIQDKYNSAKQIAESKLVHDSNLKINKTLNKALNNLFKFETTTVQSRNPNSPKVANDIVRKALIDDSTFEVLRKDFRNQTKNSSFMKTVDFLESYIVESTSTFHKFDLKDFTGVSQEDGMFYFRHKNDFQVSLFELIFEYNISREQLYKLIDKVNKTVPKEIATHLHTQVNNLYTEISEMYRKPTTKEEFVKMISSKLDETSSTYKDDIKKAEEAYDTLYNDWDARKVVTELTYAHRIHYENDLAQIEDFQETYNFNTISLYNKAHNRYNSKSKYDGVECKTESEYLLMEFINWKPKNPEEANIKRMYLSDIFFPDFKFAQNIFSKSHIKDLEELKTLFTKCKALDSDNPYFDIQIKSLEQRIQYCTNNKLAGYESKDQWVNNIMSMSIDDPRIKTVLEVFSNHLKISDTSKYIPVKIGDEYRLTTIASAEGLVKITKGAGPLNIYIMSRFYEQLKKNNQISNNFTWTDSKGNALIVKPDTTDFDKKAKDIKLDYKKAHPDAKYVYVVSASAFKEIQDMFNSGEIISYNDVQNEYNEDILDQIEKGALDEWEVPFVENRINVKASVIVPTIIEDIQNINKYVQEDPAKLYKLYNYVDTYNKYPMLLKSYLSNVSLKNTDMYHNLVKDMETTDVYYEYINAFRGPDGKLNINLDVLDDYFTDNYIKQNTEIPTNTVQWYELKKTKIGDKDAATILLETLTSLRNKYKDSKITFDSKKVLNSEMLDTLFRLKNLINIFIRQTNKANTHSILLKRRFKQSINPDLNNLDAKFVQDEQEYNKEAWNEYSKNANNFTDIISNIDLDYKRNYKAINNEYISRKASMNRDRYNLADRKLNFKTTHNIIKVIENSKGKLFTIKENKIKYENDDIKYIIDSLDMQNLIINLLNNGMNSDEINDYIYKEIVFPFVQNIAVEFKVNDIKTMDNNYMMYKNEKTDPRYASLFNPLLLIQPEELYQKHIKIQQDLQQGDLKNANYLNYIKELLNTLISNKAIDESTAKTAQEHINNVYPILEKKIIKAYSKNTTQEQLESLFIALPYNRVAQHYIHTPEKIFSQYVQINIKYELGQIEDTLNSILLSSPNIIKLMDKVSKEKQIDYMNPIQKNRITKKDFNRYVYKSDDLKKAFYIMYLEGYNRNDQVADTIVDVAIAKDYIIEKDTARNLIDAILNDISYKFSKPFEYKVQNTDDEALIINFLETNNIKTIQDLNKHFYNVSPLKNALTYEQYLLGLKAYDAYIRKIKTRIRTNDVSLGQEEFNNASNTFLATLSTSDQESIDTMMQVFYEAHMMRYYKKQIYNNKTAYQDFTKDSEMVYNINSNIINASYDFMTWLKVKFKEELDLLYPGNSAKPTSERKDLKELFNLDNSSAKYIERILQESKTLDNFYTKIVNTHTIKNKRNTLYKLLITINHYKDLYKDTITSRKWADAIKYVETKETAINAQKLQSLDFVMGQGPDDGTNVYYDINRPLKTLSYATRTVQALNNDLAKVVVDNKPSYVKSPKAETIVFKENKFTTAMRQIQSKSNRVLFQYTDEASLGVQAAAKLSREFQNETLDMMQEATAKTLDQCITTHKTFHTIRSLFTNVLKYLKEDYSKYDFVKVQDVSAAFRALEADNVLRHAYIGQYEVFAQHITDTTKINEAIEKVVKYFNNTSYLVNIDASTVKAVFGYLYYHEYCKSKENVKHAALTKAIKEAAYINTMVEHNMYNDAVNTIYTICHSTNQTREEKLDALANVLYQTTNITKEQKDNLELIIKIADQEAILESSHWSTWDTYKTVVENGVNPALYEETAEEQETIKHRRLINDIDKEIDKQNNLIKRKLTAARTIKDFIGDDIVTYDYKYKDTQNFEVLRSSINTANFNINKEIDTLENSLNKTYIGLEEQRKSMILEFIKNKHIASLLKVDAENYKKYVYETIKPLQETLASKKDYLNNTYKKLEADDLQKYIDAKMYIYTNKQIWDIIKTYRKELNMAEVVEVIKLEYATQGLDPNTVPQDISKFKTIINTLNSVETIYDSKQYKSTLDAIIKLTKNIYNIQSALDDYNKINWDTVKEDSPEFKQAEKIFETFISDIKKEKREVSKQAFETFKENLKTGTPTPISQQTKDKTTKLLNNYLKRDLSAIQEDFNKYHKTGNRTELAQIKTELNETNVDSSLQKVKTYVDTLAAQGIDTNKINTRLIELEQNTNKFELDTFSNGEHVVYYDNRAVAYLDINGKKFPFYCSTGLNPKPGVIPGQWYPFFGLYYDPTDSKSWYNKQSSKMMSVYYNSKAWEEGAKYLDKTLGDVRGKVQKDTMTLEDIKKINTGLNPVSSEEATTTDQATLDRISNMWKQYRDQTKDLLNPNKLQGLQDIIKELKTITVPDKVNIPDSVVKTALTEKTEDGTNIINDAPELEFQRITYELNNLKIKYEDIIKDAEIKLNNTTTDKYSINKDELKELVKDEYLKEIDTKTAKEIFNELVYKSIKENTDFSTYFKTTNALTEYLYEKRKVKLYNIYLKQINKSLERITEHIDVYTENINLLRNLDKMVVEVAEESKILALKESLIDKYDKELVEDQEEFIENEYKTPFRFNLKKDPVYTEIKNKIDKLKTAKDHNNEALNNINSYNDDIGKLNTLNETKKDLEEEYTKKKESLKNAMQRTHNERTTTSNSKLYNKYFKTTDAVQDLQKRLKADGILIKDEIKDAGEFELHNPTVDTLLTMYNYMYQQGIIDVNTLKIDTSKDQRFVVFDMETVKDASNKARPYQMSILEVVIQNGKIKVTPVTVYSSSVVFKDGTLENPGVLLKQFIDQQTDIYRKEDKDITQEEINRRIQTIIDNAIGRTTPLSKVLYLINALTQRTSTIVAHNGDRFDFVNFDRFIKSSVSHIVRDAYFKHNIEFNKEGIKEQINNMNLDSLEASKEFKQKMYDKLEQLEQLYRSGKIYSEASQQIFTDTITEILSEISNITIRDKVLEVYLEMKNTNNTNNPNLYKEVNEDFEKLQTAFIEYRKETDETKRKNIILNICSEYPDKQEAILTLFKNTEQQLKTSAEKEQSIVNKVTQNFITKYNLFNKYIGTYNHEARMKSMLSEIQSYTDMINHISSLKDSTDVYNEFMSYLDNTDKEIKKIDSEIKKINSRITKLNKKRITLEVTDKQLYSKLYDAFTVLRNKNLYEIRETKMTLREYLPTYIANKNISDFNKNTLEYNIHKAEEEITNMISTLSAVLKAFESFNKDDVKKLLFDQGITTVATAKDVEKEIERHNQRLLEIDELLKLETDKTVWDNCWNTLKKSADTNVKQYKENLKTVLQSIEKDFPKIIPDILAKVDSINSKEDLYKLRNEIINYRNTDDDFKEYMFKDSTLSMYIAHGSIFSNYLEIASTTETPVFTEDNRKIALSILNTEKSAIINTQVLLKALQINKEKVVYNDITYYISKLLESYNYTKDEISKTLVEAMEKSMFRSVHGSIYKGDTKDETAVKEFKESFQKAASTKLDKSEKIYQELKNVHWVWNDCKEGNDINGLTIDPEVAVHSEDENSIRISYNTEYYNGLQTLIIPKNDKGQLEPVNKWSFEFNYGYNQKGKDLDNFKNSKISYKVQDIDKLLADNKLYTNDGIYKRFLAREYLVFENGLDTNRDSINRLINLYIKLKSEKNVKDYIKKNTVYKYNLNITHLKVINLSERVRTKYAQHLALYNIAQSTDFKITNNSSLYAEIFKRVMGNLNALKYGQYLMKMPEGYDNDTVLKILDDGIDKLDIETLKAAEAAMGWSFALKDEYSIKPMFGANTNPVRSVLTSNLLYGMYTQIGTNNDTFERSDTLGLNYNKLEQYVFNPESWKKADGKYDKNNEEYKAFKKWAYKKIDKETNNKHHENYKKFRFKQLLDYEQKRYNILVKSYGDKTLSIFTPRVAQSDTLQKYDKDILHPLGLNLPVAFTTDNRAFEDDFLIDRAYAEALGWNEGNKTWIKYGFKGAVKFIDGLYDMYGAVVVGKAESVEDRGAYGAYLEMAFNKILEYKLGIDTENSWLQDCEFINKLQMFDTHEQAEEYYKNNDKDLIYIVDGKIATENAEKIDYSKFLDALIQNKVDLKNKLITPTKTVNKNFMDLLKATVNSGSISYTIKDPITGEDRTITYSASNNTIFRGTLYTLMDAEHIAAHMQTAAQLQNKTDSELSYISKDIAGSVEKGGMWSFVVEQSAAQKIGYEWLNGIIGGEFDTDAQVLADNTFQIILKGAKALDDKIIRVENKIDIEATISNIQLELKLPDAYRPYLKEYYYALQQHQENPNDSIWKNRLEIAEVKLQQHALETYNGPKGLAYRSRFRRFWAARNQLLANTSLKTGEIKFPANAFEELKKFKGTNDIWEETSEPITIKEVNKLLLEYAKTYTPKDLIQIDVDGKFIKAYVLVQDKQGNIVKDAKGNDETKEIKRYADVYKRLRYLGFLDDNYIIHGKFVEEVQDAKRTTYIDSIELKEDTLKQTTAYVVAIRSPVQDYAATPVLKITGVVEHAAVEGNAAMYALMGADNDGDTAAFIAVKPNEVRNGCLKNLDASIIESEDDCIKEYADGYYDKGYLQKLRSSLGIVNEDNNEADNALNYYKHSTTNYAYIGKKTSSNTTYTANKNINNLTKSKNKVIRKGDAHYTYTEMLASASKKEYESLQKTIKEYIKTLTQNDIKNILDSVTGKEQDEMFWLESHIWINSGKQKLPSEKRKNGSEYNKNFYKDPEQIKEYYNEHAEEIKELKITEYYLNNTLEGIEYVEKHLESMINASVYATLVRGHVSKVNIGTTGGLRKDVNLGTLLSIFPNMNRTVSSNDIDDIKASQNKLWKEQYGIENVEELTVEKLCTAVFPDIFTNKTYWTLEKLEELKKNPMTFANVTKYSNSLDYEIISKTIAETVIEYRLIEKVLPKLITLCKEKSPTYQMVYDILIEEKDYLLPPADAIYKELDSNIELRNNKVNDVILNTIKTYYLSRFVNDFNKAIASKKSDEVVTEYLNNFKKQFILTRVISKQLNDIIQEPISLSKHGSSLGDYTLVHEELLNNAKQMAKDLAINKMYCGNSIHHLRAINMAGEYDIYDRKDIKFEVSQKLKNIRIENANASNKDQVLNKNNLQNTLDTALDVISKYDICGGFISNEEFKEFKKHFKNFTHALSNNLSKYNISTINVNQLFKDTDVSKLIDAVKFFEHYNISIYRLIKGVEHILMKIKEAQGYAPNISTTDDAYKRLIGLYNLKGIDKKSLQEQFKFASPEIVYFVNYITEKDNPIADAVIINEDDIFGEDETIIDVIADYEYDAKDAWLSASENIPEITDYRFPKNLQESKTLDLFIQDNINNINLLSNKDQLLMSLITDILRVDNIRRNQIDIINNHKSSETESDVVQKILNENVTGYNFIKPYAKKASEKYKDIESNSRQLKEIEEEKNKLREQRLDLRSKKDKLNRRKGSAVDPKILLDKLNEDKQALQNKYDKTYKQSVKFAMLENIADVLYIIQKDNNSSNLKILDNEEVKNFNKQLLVNMDSYQHPFSILVNSFRNDATDDIDWNRMYKYIKDNYANIRITQVIKASDEEGLAKQLIDYITIQDNQKYNGKTWNELSKREKKKYLHKHNEIVKVKSFKDLQDLTKNSIKDVKVILKNKKVYDVIGDDVKLEDFITPTLKQIKIKNANDLKTIWKQLNSKDAPALGFTYLNDILSATEDAYKPYTLTGKGARIAQAFNFTQKALLRMSSGFLLRNAMDTFNQLVSDMYLEKGLAYIPMNSKQLLKYIIYGENIYKVYKLISEERMFTLSKILLANKNISSDINIDANLNVLKRFLNSYIKQGKYIDNASSRILDRVKIAEEIMERFNKIKTYKDKQNVAAQMTKFLTNIKFAEYYKMFDTKIINGEQVLGLRIDADAKEKRKGAEKINRIVSKQDSLFESLLIEYSAFNQTNAQIDMFKEKQYKDLYNMVNQTKYELTHNSPDKTIKEIEEEIAFIRTESEKDINAWINNKPLKIYNHITERTESLARILGFIFNREIYGKSFDDSVQQSLKTWFNYGQRSPLEIQLMYDVPYISFPIRSITNWMTRLLDPRYAILMDDIIDGVYGQYADDDGQYDEYTQFMIQNGWIPITDKFGIRAGSGAFDIVNLLKDPVEQLEQRRSPILRGLQKFIQSGDLKQSVKQLATVGSIDKAAQFITAGSYNTKKGTWSNVSLGRTFTAFFEYNQYTPKKYNYLYHNNGRAKYYENIYKDWFNKYGRMRKPTQDPVQLVKNVQWKQFLKRMQNKYRR